MTSEVIISISNMGNKFSQHQWGMLDKSEMMFQGRHEKRGNLVPAPAVKPVLLLVYSQESNGLFKDVLKVSKWLNTVC